MELSRFKMFGLAVLVIVLSLSPANCYCRYTKTFYATEDAQTIQHMYYGSSEDCVFSIQPSDKHNKYFDYSKYLTQWQKYFQYRQYEYFLEMSWTKFSVKGNMPDCSNDYVEIFLTKYVLGHPSLQRNHVVFV